MTPLLAQAAFAGTVGHWLILLLVVAGIIGIFMVVAKQAGIEIPQWVIHVLWIVFAVVVGVVAIKFLLTML